MKPALLIACVLPALTLSACGKLPDEMRAYLLADGDWGWDNGAGCAGRAHVWSVEGNTLTRYRDGAVEEVATGLVRTPLYDNYRESGDGALEYVRWEFNAAAPDGSGTFGSHEMWFAIRGGPFRPTALVPRNRRDFTAASGGERREYEEPNIENRLVHCSEVEG
jgi:hypothetical protein